MYGKTCGDGTVTILNLAAPLAHLRVKLVAQDREEPGFQIGARLEARLLVPRLHKRFLNEVVCTVRILGKGHGKSPQGRDRRQQTVAETLGFGHALLLGYRL